VGPANERDVVCPVELLDATLPEEVPCASGGNGPSLNLIGVGPHEIAHGAAIGYFLFSVERANVVEVVGRGR